MDNTATPFTVGDTINWSMSVTQGGGGGPVKAFFNYRDGTSHRVPSLTSDQEASSSGSYTVTSGFTGAYTDVARDDTAYLGTIVASATCTPAAAADPTPTLTFTTPSAASADLNGAVLTNAAGSSISGGGTISYGSGTSGTATVSSSGVVTSVGAGTSTITVTQAASAGHNAVGTQTYALTVNPALVANQSVASQTLTQGSGAGLPFTPVTGSGGSGSYTYALYNAANSATATLPAGMSFNTGTGQISSTPSATQSATTYTVRVTDTATAPTTTSSTFSLTVSAAATPAPTVTSTSPSSGATAGGTSVTITGTNFTGATAVTIGGTSATAITVVSATSITATTPAGSTGTASVLVTTAGGTNAANTLYTYAAPAPTVTVISPSSGTTAGGTSVTITGTNFTGATAVTIGGTSATSITVVSATSITATAPAGSAGTASVLVTTAGGTNAANTLYTYVTPTPAPTVTAISPSSGTTAGGTSVTITGTNFTGATAVTIGGTSATVITVVSATSITATTPAGSAGTASVLVTTGGGTNAANTLYTYVTPTPAPTVTAISPSSGATAGGTSVTITGTNFTGATAVTIGGASATGITVVSATSITATTPAGSAGTASVLVTTAAGTNAGNTLYTYVTPTPAPTVTAISPSSGTTAGGTSVTITGTNFTGATAVTIGGTSATSITVVSATSITATTPAGSAGTASILVTTGGGTNAANTLYTYVTPTPGPVAGAVSVTVAFNSPSILIPLSLSGGAAVSVAVSTGPGHGTATASGTTISYTPTPGYSGVDGFAYTVSNGAGTSPPATVSITVSSPPAPSVSAISANVPFNSAGTAVALAPLGTYTTLSLASAPSHGTVSLSGSTATYTPTTNYYGPDSFTYAATGPGGTSAAATVALTIAAPVGPIATAKLVTVTVTAAAAASSGPTTIDLTASVANASGLIIVTPPTHGTATVQGFSVLYVPAPGYYGADSFTYAAVGFPGSAPVGGSALLMFKAGGHSSGAEPVILGAGAGVGSSTANSSVSAPALVSIVIPAPLLTITPASLPPLQAVGYSQTFTTTGGTAPYVYTVSAGALPPGMVLSPAGVLSGKPTGPGTFTFTIKSTDGSTGSGPFSMSQVYTLVAALPPPVPAAAFTVQVAAEKSGTADLSKGASGGPFSGAAMVSISPASAGTASISLTSTLPLAGGGTVISSDGPHYLLTFKPTLHFSGPATVTYTLSNGFGTSAPGNVIFQVAARLDPTLDPDVKGLIGAQTDAARRFGEAQIQNFNQRLESLHKDGYGRTNNGISFGFSPDQGDPREAAMRIANGSWPNPYDPEAERLNPPGGATPAVTSSTPRGGNAKLAKSDTAPNGDSQATKVQSDFAVWSGGGVDFGMHESAQGRSGFHFTTGGISLGVDYRVNDSLTLGAGAGYGQDASRIGSAGTKSTANNYVGAVYASYRPIKDIFLDGVLGYGQMSFNSRRFVTIDDAFALGKRHGDETFLSVTAGYEYQKRGLHLSPYGRLDAIDGTLDAFTESEAGGGFGALSFKSQSLSILTSTLGLRGDFIVPVSYGVWSPFARVEYKHDFESVGLASLQYADWLNGPTYSTAADPLSQNQVLVGFGADLKAGTLQLSLEYKGSVANRDEVVHTVIGKIVFPF